MLAHRLNSPSINSLIDLATQGHFALFSGQWYHDFSQEELYRPFCPAEKANLKNLFKMLARHENLERKKTVLLSLKDEERLLFLRGFLSMVENKILDQRPTIQ